MHHKIRDTYRAVTFMNHCFFTSLYLRHKIERKSRPMENLRMHIWIFVFLAMHHVSVQRLSPTQEVFLSGSQKPLTWCVTNKMLRMQ